MILDKNRQNHTPSDLIYADAQPGKRSGKSDPARRRRLVAAVLTLVAVLALGSIALALRIGIQQQEKRYVQAAALLDSREYDAAQKAYEALGDYRDSRSRAAGLAAQRAAYDAAGELLAQQRYDEAVAAYRALEDYADSALQAACGVTYQKALDLLNQTDAGQTQLLTRILGSQPRLTDEKGYPAIVGYEAAAALFESLDGYADTAVLIDRCYYSAGLVKLEWRDWEGALAYTGRMSAAASTAFYREYEQRYTENTSQEGP